MSGLLVAVVVTLISVSAIRAGSRADQERERMRAEGVQIIAWVAKVSGGTVKGSYQFAGRSWTLDLGICGGRTGRDCPAVGTTTRIWVDPQAPGHTMTGEGSLDDLGQQGGGPGQKILVVAVSSLTGFLLWFLLAGGRSRDQQGWDADRVARLSPKRRAQFENFFEEDPVPPMFAIGLRGYDRYQVDQFFRRFEELLGDQDLPPLPRPVFDLALRGYDRSQVDGFVHSLYDAP
ncbi:hypothetical protein [Actinomadura sp. HBU206391]|uniref:hypothetical protein n=1 Tax=Actinomadura sp. HBU206391 TaxID=2731692 RepID=UPI0016506818|nr:hypothetical protein [Actinomadura sp. HBU206391]MBC6458503.1 hypothetical protein [Actinomadura sp. HBU206391]